MVSRGERSRYGDARARPRMRTVGAGAAWWRVVGGGRALLWRGAHERRRAVRGKVL
jgi:hypothetical protein